MGTTPDEHSDRDRALIEAVRGLRYDGPRIVVDELIAREIVPVPSAAQAREELAVAERAQSERRRVDARTGLAASMHAAGLSRNACAAQQSAIDLQPDAGTHHENLMLYAQSAGDFSMAIRACQNLLALLPDHPTARGRLAVLYYFTEEFAAAWAEVHAAESVGRLVPPQLRGLLEEQMPEPRR